MGGRAFIVTQSIKKLSDTLQQAVFSDTDYHLLSSDEPATIKDMKEFDRHDPENKDLYNDRIYKIIPADKAFDLGLYEEKAGKNGSVRKVKSKAVVPQKIIVSFSRKMMEYQRYIRNRQIERAKKLLKNLDDSAKDILEVSTNRYKIEDCFRMMKTNFSARPVFHQKRERIIAHFMICYTALLIYRLMEKKLDLHGTHYTESRKQVMPCQRTHSAYSGS